MSSGDEIKANNVLETKWPLFTNFSFDNLFKSTQNLLRKDESTNNEFDETGWDRLKGVWNSVKNGEPAVETEIISNAMSFAGLTGLVVGGILHSKTAMQSYIKRHNENIFKGHYEANRRLSDHIYINFFRTGVRQAIRYSLFCGTFVGSLVLCTTYRNDIYYRDCALATAISATLWKAHLGTRAVAVNAAAGAIFGLTFAAIMKMLMKISGTSIAEMRYYNRPIKNNLPNDPK